MRILLAAVLTLVFSSAGCVDDGAGPTKDEPQTDSGTDGRGDAAAAARTLLVYMAADNSLGRCRFDEYDKAEMEQAARYLPAASHVLVYHDASTGDPSLLELTATGWVTLKGYPGNESEVRATSAERMAEVFDDMRRLAPADAYGLVLWSHGSGWDEQPSSRAAAPRRSFGQDYRAGETLYGSTMAIPTLAEALRGQGFDFVYFDCCFMATVEVAYELRGCTHYVVASPTELPADGMPYDNNLPLLASASPDMAEVARSTFDYYDALSGTDRWCAMTVVDCRELDALAAATRRVMATAQEVPDAQSVQRYTTYSPCYLYDLADYVEHAAPADDAALEAWRQALARAVIYHANTPYIYEEGMATRALPMLACCGLSTHLVQTAADGQTAGYSRLQWWQDVASTYPYANNL